MDILYIVFKIIGLASITYLWITSEPTQLFISFMVDKKIIKDTGYIHRLLTCPLCSGFWIALLFIISSEFLGDYVNKGIDILLTASIASVVSVFMFNKLNQN